MAHTKAQKAAKGNRDSQSKRLGIKVFGGGMVKTGYVIVRQRGSRFKAGEGVLESRDNTLIAVRPGQIKFYQKLGKKFVSVV